MAIVNTFAKCLESPYFFADLEAPGRVSGLLRLADSRIELASTLQGAGQGDPADVALFSYEAMFACLRALVYSRGYREAGLRCLMLACEEWFVRPGKLDAGHLLAFERAQSLKLAPAEAIEAARAFRTRAEELLSS